MRKLVVTTFLTLDGVMQAPGGPEEDPDENFSYGGWSFTYFDDAMGEVMDGIMNKPFDMVLGRRTYELFASFWPNAPEEAGGQPLNNATKHVASRTLTSLEWQNSVLIEGEVPEAVAALKQQDGPELQVHGSSNLLQTLLKHELVDEFHLHTFPVVVGSGKRLFAEGTTPSGLKLVDSKITSTGVVSGTYVPTGPIVTGTFG